MSASFLILASAEKSVPVEYPEWWMTLIYITGIVFFLLFNAFFVAAEFAIVKVRPSQIEGELESKPRRAGITKKVIENLDRYLSANQLGVSFASLALGALGQPFVTALLGPTLNLIPWMSTGAIFWISAFLAWVFFTFLLVTVGELVPKSIAYRKPVATSLLLSRPLHIFYVITAPITFLFTATANWLLRVVFRIDPVSGSEAVHSSEELALLVEESERQQEVTETEREILINALELNDITVKDVMTPRSEVIFLDIEKGFPENLEHAIQATHTRFPLVKGHLDETLGLIHIKDVLKLMNEHDQDLLHIKRELKVVPEVMKLDDLLKFFLTERAQLALVVDEFGDPAGLVFMDNIMAELVGNIQDEFDTDEVSDFHRLNADEFNAEGGLTLNELSDHEPALHLEGGDVSTIGGYIVQRLGHLPDPGEKVKIDGFEATVTRTDGRRIEEVNFIRLPEPEIPEEES